VGRRRAEKFEITAEGSGAEDVPKDESNLVVTGERACAWLPHMPCIYVCVCGSEGRGLTRSCCLAGMKAAFQAAGKPMPPLKYHCNNRIPYAR
jgi:homoserine kinase